MVHVVIQKLKSYPPAYHIRKRGTFTGEIGYTKGKIFIQLLQETRSAEEFEEIYQFFNKLPKKLE